MRPQLGVESGRLLFRAALSDTPGFDGHVRDVEERLAPSEGPAELWRIARETAVDFVGGTAESEAAIVPVVVEDGSSVVDPEARRIGAADALLANWVATARPTTAVPVLLVHIGEARTTARLVRFRPGAALSALAGTDLSPVEFGLRDSVDAVLDRLGESHPDRVRPTLNAPMLRAILEFGLGLHAAEHWSEIRWRGPLAAFLWQPMCLSPQECAARAAASRLAPLVDEAARLAASGPVRVVFGGAGAYFPDAVAKFAERLDRSAFTVDPSAVAHGAARWREETTAAPRADIRPVPASPKPAEASTEVPPWSR